MDRMIAYIIRLIVRLSRYTAALAKLGIGKYEAWKPGEPLKLLLVGYNGVRNTGADARVIAMVEQIEEVFGAEQVQISVMTLDASTMQGYFSERVRLIPFSTIFFGDVYRACSTHHAVVLCEGSTLKSTFANALTMFFCEAAGIMKQQQKPCIAYGSEVGDMEPFLQKMAKELCSDTYFIVRTEDSYQRLQALGLRGHVGTDTAWTFQAEAEQEQMKRILMQTGWDGKQPVLGVAVINPFWWPVKPSLTRWLKAAVTGDRALQFNKWYFFSDSAERRVQFQQYISRIADAVNRFCAEENCHVAIIGMERLDAAACKTLADLIQQPVSMFLSRDYNAFQLTGVIRNLSYLVTSRYHASVLSMEQQIPVVAVSMDERLDAIMKEVHLHDEYLHHVRDARLGEQIYQSLKTGVEQKQEIQQRIAHQLTYYRQNMQQMGVFLKTYLYETITNHQN